MLHLPAAALSRGFVSLSGVCRAEARIVSVILIPFRLSHISCFTPQQPQVLLCPKQLPCCGDLTPASVSPPSGCKSSPHHSPLYSTSRFILLSFVWVCMFFSSGHIFLPTVSWCSARPSVSEGICGERCTPCLCTVPPSSAQKFGLFLNIKMFILTQ